MHTIENKRLVIYSITIKGSIARKLKDFVKAQSLD